MKNITVPTWEVEIQSGFQERAEKNHYADCSISNCPLKK